MSIIKLTQNLENFQWTAYDSVGDNNSPITREHERVQFNTPQSFYDGHSKVVTGQKTFNRPDKQALADMESRFGPLETDPGTYKDDTQISEGTRGPYGIADYMDGRQRGRGFTAPGQAPLGFIVDMESLTGGVTSQLDIDGSISLTPLSHVIAGVNSALDYGVVPSKMIMLGPAAEGAWGVKTLPISTYSSRILSREELEGYTNAPVGGRVYYYGRLESLYNKDSMFQKEDGTYSTPTGADLTVPSSGTEFQNFMEYGGRGFQRTFNIPASYPNNTSVFSIDSQFGWSHSSKFLEISSHPWSSIPSEWLEKKSTTHEVPWTQAEIDQGWLISDEEGDSRESSFKQVYTTTQTIVHPIQPIYLNSEPTYNAPSWLELQFLTNWKSTEGVWPYGVLGYSNPDTTGPHVFDNHPLIRKTVGQRYEIEGDFFDRPDFSWMALQLKRTAEDTTRINKWLETSKGKAWQEKQHILQNLNPREETRDWSRSNLILSIPPFIHATRHFGGETYEEKADFGPIFHGDSPQGTSIGSLFSGTKFGKWVGKVTTKIGDKMEAADTAIGGALAGLDSLFGGIDFNEKGGRLQFLTDKMIKQIPDDGGFGGLMTNMRSAYTPYGRPPKVPTQTVFSQKGAYGQGNANENVLANASGIVLQKYKTLSYGKLDDDIYSYEGKEGTTYMPASPGEFTGGASDVGFSPGIREEQLAKLALDRKKGKAIVQDIGQQGRPLDTEIYESTHDDSKEGAGLGIINKGPEGKYNNKLTDKINIHPYGTDLPDSVSDFIKFKFKDIVNNKYIIFRAILSGISDAITPEWSGTQYIGRPDKVYVYKGAERKVSFTFEIFPKTKQEFPVLMEKLNYLIGLCYPSFTPDNRMIAPFIELTLGDMFKNTPGFLDSLSVDVDDNSPWEIDEGLQFPHHITCQCSFTYIGKYMPSSLGKHYELPWLQDAGWTTKGQNTLMGTFQLEGDGKIEDTNKPQRTVPMKTLFDSFDEKATQS